MRLKLLLLLLFATGILYAQEPYRNLIFSEVRMDEHHFSYAEITNMGDKTIDLSEFELGSVGPWTQPWTVDEDHRIRLPKKNLAPGESFLIATIWDLAEKMYKIDPERWAGRRRYTEDMNAKVDLGLYPPETDNGVFAIDSVSPGNASLETWSGRNCFYLRHFYTPTDSAVIDAVNAIFTSTSSPYKVAAPSDVAGVTRGTQTRILVRKFTVKQGVGDALDTWVKSAGIDINDSEWLPVPRVADSWGNPKRKQYWTIGNHGNFQLNSTTIQSDYVTVNWAASKMTVDYGVRKLDGLMKRIREKPGIAWEYKNSLQHADSGYVSVRTGDTLIVYVVGNTLMTKKFALVAAAPEADAKVVVPLNDFNEANNTWGGARYGVTEDEAVIDSIINVPFAERVDSLFKYLEKPANATWQIIWVDGKQRVDLKLGDKLKVTAQNGSTKEYFIKVDKFLPSHNANLASITWPDIPEYFKGLYSWVQDTIPNFNPTKYSYVVDIPAEITNVPALVTTSEDLNNRVTVQRAISLEGSTAARTVVFNTQAEDDTTLLSYSVTINRLKDEEKMQPFYGDPFISQFVWQEQWASGFMEVVNPGNRPLDMSNYMFCFGYVNTPAGAITRLGAAGDWANRYGKYIPGYKWVDQAKWETQPGIVVQDLNVNTIVYPGDVFVIGDIRGTGQSGYPWWASKQCDVDFGHFSGGEAINNWSALQQWNGANWYLFRIENDSIVRGLKAAIDPNDFTLLDVFGSGDGSNPVIGGQAMQQINAFTRKPHIYKGNPEFKGSFGTDAATSEWTKTDRPYWGAKGYGWPNDILMINDGLGSHFMNEVTVYKSTVASLVYKLSDGYSQNETLRGVKTGTTVNDFKANILKADPNQSLNVKKAGTGAILAGTDLLTKNDTLVVLSADSLNTTKYVLDVTTIGLSNDAKLTSATYTVTIAGATGTIAGFAYGTNLKTVYDNVVAPVGASINVIDNTGLYVSFKRLNFDTLFVDTKVSDKIHFEVIAEDGLTKINYTLKPTASTSDAFVVSELYAVDQTSGLIKLVPRGTAVDALFRNIAPATGAAVKLIDKAGFERTSGNMSMDDKLIVTSQDGKTVKVYYFSMLSDELFEPKYLAYVTSSVYSVDQVNLTLQGASGKTTLTDFYSKIVAAPGATAKVVNAQGVENKGTDLNDGDKLKVSAADGVTVVYYALKLDLTGVEDLDANEMTIFPNPTNGVVNLSGIPGGSFIRVYNLQGASVLEKVAGRSLEVISLQDQPAGLYFITVNNGGKAIGKFKLIKE